MQSTISRFRSGIANMIGGTAATPEPAPVPSTTPPINAAPPVPSSATQPSSWDAMTPSTANYAQRVDISDTKNTGFPVFFGKLPATWYDSLPVWVIPRAQQNSLEAARDAAKALRSTDVEANPIQTIPITAAGSYPLTVPAGSKGQIYMLRLMFTAAALTATGGEFEFSTLGVLPGMSTPPAPPTETAKYVFNLSGAAYTSILFKTYWTMANRSHDGVVQVTSFRAENAQDGTGSVTSPVFRVYSMPAGWTVQARGLVPNQTAARVYDALVEGWLRQDQAICKDCVNQANYIAAGQMFADDKT